MENQIFACGIIADQPTRLGSIYTRETLEQAVRAFNIAAKNRPVAGSVIDRLHIQRTDPITHYTNSLFFNDSGMLCAQIKLIDNDLIKRLNEGQRMIARPVISVPSFELDRSPLRVTSIDKIIRIQLECDDDESK